MLWVLRTGAPWRDLPPDYGKWGTVHQRFIRWRNSGFWEELLYIIIDLESDELQWLMIDASHENIEKVEEFIAHQLPDIAASVAAPVVMLVILFAVDWRFGPAAFVGIAIAFIIQMMVYGKDSAEVWMARYQSSIEEMNNAAVEYVRGIPVVKAFRQTVFFISQSP